MPGNNNYPVISGLLTGIIATVIVLGSLTLSLNEGAMVFAGDIHPTDTILSAPLSTETIPPDPNSMIELSVTLIEPTVFASSTERPSLTAISTPMKVRVCPPPGGWYVITIQNGDTLNDLAKKYNTTIDVLAKANCLSVGTEISPEIVIYVPGPASPANGSCPTPNGWSQYSIQSGDTLGLISQKANTTIQKIQEGNCLGNSTNIQVGQIIYIPSISASATLSPWFTSTPGNWTSNTPASYYSSPTYDPFRTEIPPSYSDTPMPSASANPYSGPFLSATPISSTTMPEETSHWPFTLTFVASTPWPSATEE